MATVKCANCGKDCCIEHVYLDAEDGDFCLCCHFDWTGGPFKPQILSRKEWNNYLAELDICKL